MKTPAILFCTLLLAASPVLAQEAKPAETQKLIEQLGDAEYSVRRAAEARLLELGKAALPALKDNAETHDDPEVQWRAGRLVRRTSPGTSPSSRAPTLRRSITGNAANIRAEVGYASTSAHSLAYQATHAASHIVAMPQARAAARGRPLPSTPINATTARATNSAQEIPGAASHSKTWVTSPPRPATERSTNRCSRESSSTSPRRAAGCGLFPPRSTASHQTSRCSSQPGR